MKRTLLFALLCALALLAASCKRGPRVIPRGELIEIYADMYLADQFIREDYDLRRQADTLLVYEGILQKWGYNTDDYLYTVDVYLRDPERFAKLLSKTSDLLSARSIQVDREIRREEWREKYLGMDGKKLDVILKPFSKDGVFLGWGRVERDTVSDAWFQLVPIVPDSIFYYRDSVAVALDSLAVQADSLAVQADSLAVAADSLSTKE